LQGFDGLHPQHSAWSTQFKLQVLSHVDREKLWNCHIAAMFEIRNPNQVVFCRRKIDQGGE